jgi:phage I-like protein
MLRAAPAPQPSGEGSAAALPDRFPLLRWGTNESTKGPIIVNEKTAAVLPRNQALIKRPEIHGDFEHESSKPDARHPINYAAKNARPIVIPGEGLFVEGVQWTPLGTAHVPQDYQDLSATVYLDDAGVVIGLHSFAVTAHGEVDGIGISTSGPAPSPLSADLALLSASIFPNQPTETPPMNPNALLVKLLAFLGVQASADATPEELAAAVDKAMAAEKAEPGEPPTELSASTAAALAKLNAKLESLSSTQAAILAGQDKAEIENMVRAASLQGKLVQLSADDLLLLGKDRAKAHLDSLKPDVVPLAQRTPTALSAGATVTPAHDPDFAQAFIDAGMPVPAPV